MTTTHLANTDLRMAEEIATDAEQRNINDIVDLLFSPEVRKAAEAGLFKTLVVICRRGNLTYDEGSFDGARHLGTTKHWYFVSETQHKERRLRMMQDRLLKVVGASVRREDGNVNVKDKETKTVEVIPEVRFILTWPRRQPSPIIEWNNNRQPATFPSLLQVSSHSVTCHLKAGHLKYEGVVVGNNASIQNLALPTNQQIGLLPSELYKSLGPLQDDSIRIFDAFVAVHVNTSHGASFHIHTWKSETGWSLRLQVAQTLKLPVQEVHLFLNGNLIKDSRTSNLADLGVTNGCTIEALSPIEQNLKRVRELVTKRREEENTHISAEQFLVEHGLEDLLEVFHQQGLTNMLHLKHLSHELLLEMGITSIGCRLSILQGVSNYFESCLPE